MGFYNIHNDPKVLITIVAFLHQYQYRIIKKLTRPGPQTPPPPPPCRQRSPAADKKKLSITNNLLKLYFSFSTALLCLRFGVIFEYLTMNKVYYLKLSRWY